jgi:hypothetical protein
MVKSLRPDAAANSVVRPDLGIEPFGATNDVPPASWPATEPAIYRRTVPEQMAG